MDIGPHVFPTRKYALVRERLLAAGLARDADFVEPPLAAWDELALVHTPDYLERIRTGNLSAAEAALLELPWSDEIVDGFRRMVAGTVEAALLACGMESLRSELKSPKSSRRQTSDLSGEAGSFRCAAHIGGGLHHAFANHGEGFCPFNDVAVAVRVLQRRGFERAAIVDLDVHHGNGTSFIFGGAPPPPQTRSRGGARAYPEQDVADNSGVFTFSMHQQHNYPMWKPASSLDIGLPDGTHDATYLRELERALPAVMAHRPRCVFYLAGADPYEDDQLGGLRLTKDGLRRRDRAVIEAVRAAGVPLVVTLAGGYARKVEDTVAIHVATLEEAMRA
jgi:acetoin utilization deacetylase AcuC-like enzyme